MTPLPWVISGAPGEKLFPVIQLMERNTKQFLKVQLFDLEVLEHTNKGLGKNNLRPNLIKMVAFNLTLIFTP